METLLIILMVVTAIVAIFYAIALICNCVKSNKEEVKEVVVEKIVEKVVEKEPVKVVEEVKAEEKVEEKAEVVETVAVSAEDDENAVTFSADKGQTLDDKYNALSSENKSIYDDIVKYAAAIEESKRFKNLRYEEYKIGSSRIVRLTIKRNIIHCEFMMHNSNFKNYIAENKVSVRQSATVIKVTGKEVVQTIKDTIDIVVKAIGEEREFKKQLAREKRRAKRQGANA